MQPVTPKTIFFFGFFGSAVIGKSPIPLSRRAPFARAWRVPQRRWSEGAPHNGRYRRSPQHSHNSGTARPLAAPPPTGARCRPVGSGGDRAGADREPERTGAV